MSYEKSIKKLIEECKFSDYGVSGGREYICCTAIPPLLSSGILCPVFVLLGLKERGVKEAGEKYFFNQQRGVIPKCCLPQYRQMI